jgi:hypothetical protein
MAAKKYASTEILNAKGKPIETRGVDASKEVVKDKDDTGKEIEVKVTEAIVSFVTAASQEKSSKEKKDKAAGLIRSFVGDVREFFAKKKDFTKTYRIFGTENDQIKYAVDVSSSDKFTPPSKKEDLAALKKLLTAGVFNQIFDEEKTISIKKVISDDDKKRRELTKLLVDTLGEDKVKEYFEMDVTHTVKSGLSSKIYDFTEEIQDIIRENIKASADAVKDASEIKG